MQTLISCIREELDRLNIVYRELYRILHIRTCVITWYCTVHRRMGNTIPHRSNRRERFITLAPIVHCPSFVSCTVTSSREVVPRNSHMYVRQFPRNGLERCMLVPFLVVVTGSTWQLRDMCAPKNWNIKSTFKMAEEWPLFLHVVFNILSSWMQHLYCCIKLVKNVGYNMQKEWSLLSPFKCWFNISVFRVWLLQGLSLQLRLHSNA